jgi:hypothetical protein
MTTPRARIPPRYDDPFIRGFQQRVDRLELNAFQKGRDIEMTSGQTVTRGVAELPPQPRVILRSPDGARWALTVDNAGVLTTVAVT